MFYKQAFFFDNTKWPVYIVMNTMNVWVGMLILMMIFGELNIIAELLMHLNTCYLELRRDLKLVTADLLKSDDTKNIAANYRRELIKVLTRNKNLNRFANEMEKQFTFRLFITFSFSALILCVVLFIYYKVRSIKSIRIRPVSLYNELIYTESSRKCDLHGLVYF